MQQRRLSLRPYRLLNQTSGCTLIPPRGIGELKHYMRETKMNRVLLCLAVVAITFVLTPTTYGTIQRSDIILYNGIVYQLRTPTPNRTLPLDTLWKDQKTKPRLYSIPGGMSSNCWRGYVAIWEIADDTLFLKGIDAWQVEHEKARIPLQEGGIRVDPSAGSVKSDLRKLFPKRFKEHRVKADWFSGNLTLTTGYLNKVMEELPLQFKNGKILTSPKNNEKEEHNQQLESGSG